MFGFILDYLVNVIVLCVAIPVTEKIFDCQIRGFDSLLTYLNIPVTSGTELMMTSAVIVAAAVLVMFFCLYFVPGFDRSLCYSYGRRKPNSLEAAYIQDILMDIEAAARDVPDLEIPELHVYISGQMQLNAFSIGRGSIVIMRPLLQALDRDEVRGVLAHEIGHLVHRDTIWGLLRFAAASVGQTAIQFLSLIASGFAFLALIPLFGFLFIWMSLFINAIIYGLQFILRIPASLLALCGSRQNEYDADAFAVKLGFGPGLYRALLVLSNGATDNMTLSQRLQSTHPVTRDRLKRIVEIMNGEKQA